MCNNGYSSDNPFAGLDDFDNEVAVPNRDSEFSKAAGNVEIPLYEEKCPKCNGTGNWRPGYKCFKCKGTGKLTFKTSPEARVKSRKAAQRRKAASEAENIAAFAEQEPAAAKWLSESNSGFAVSLLEGVAKYGRLTEGQLAAVYKSIARDQEREEQKNTFADDHPEAVKWLEANAETNNFAASLLGALKRYGSLTEGQLGAVQRNLEREGGFNETDLDISPLLKGWYAVPDGDTRLKLFVRRPGKNSKWHGHIYVDDGGYYGNRKTYGKQAPGSTYQGDVVDALKAILKDPKAAQAAYGHLTGTCGRCGRPLEDEASVARGLGPVCATKWG